MTTIRSSLQQAVLQLKQAGIPSAALDARLLLQHVLQKPHEYVATHSEAALTQEQQTENAAFIDRRAAREPVACITGIKEFYGLEFRTNRHTLDPRPDTETLVEAVKCHVERSETSSKRSFADAQDDMHILDLGTGTGCILLTLLHLFPQARGVGVDASEEALAIARENAERLGLAERARFVRGDWAAGLAGPFNIIVSNPPYIPTSSIVGLEAEVRNYDPMKALDGGADGLNRYRELLPTIRGKLKPSGLLALEIGQGQESEVAALVEAHGFKVKELRKDLAGIGRCVVATSLRGA